MTERKKGVMAMLDSNGPSRTLKNGSGVFARESQATGAISNWLVSKQTRLLHFARNYAVIFL